MENRTFHVCVCLHRVFESLLCVFWRVKGHCQGRDGETLGLRGHKRLLPPLHHVLARPSHSCARQMSRAITAATGRPGPPGRPSCACLTSPWPYSVIPPPTPHLLSRTSNIRHSGAEQGGRREGKRSWPPQEETMADKTGCCESRLDLLCL